MARSRLLVTPAMSLLPRLLLRCFPVLAFLALGALPARAQAVLATIPAGTEPRAVAVNPVTNRIYVVNEFSNDVTVIDGATRAATRVAVGKRPQYIAVNTRTNRVFV